MRRDVSHLRIHQVLSEFFAYSCVRLDLTSTFVPCLVSFGHMEVMLSLYSSE